jgi:hypothetical protein
MTKNNIEVCLTSLLVIKITRLQDKVNYCDVKGIDDIGNTMKFYELKPLYLCELEKCFCEHKIHFLI